MKLQALIPKKLLHHKLCNFPDCMAVCAAIPSVARNEVILAEDEILLEIVVAFSAEVESVLESLYQPKCSITI